MQILLPCAAEGNSCSLGYVEINTWQILKAYRQYVMLNECVSLHRASICRLVGVLMVDKGNREVRKLFSQHYINLFI